MHRTWESAFLLFIKEFRPALTQIAKFIMHVYNNIFKAAQWYIFNGVIDVN